MNTAVDWEDTGMGTVYVMRKPQIRTILGLFAQSSDSTFAHAILGLSNELCKV